MSPDEKRLEAAYSYIRETYFPRWDRAGKWKVRLEPECPSFGLCDEETKTIILRVVTNDEVEFFNLLIHEICHFVGGKHGNLWKLRVKKAANTAEAINNKILADRLRLEIERYDEEKTITITAGHIYDMISDAVFDNPEITYEQVIGQVARMNGLYPEELKKDYKRSRKVYNKAVRDRQE